VVSLAALCACKGDPSTPQYWEKAVKGGRYAQDRVAVLEDLRASKKLTPAFAPMLEGLLAAEKKERVKQELAVILGELGQASSVQPLGDAMDLGAGNGDTNGMNRAIAVALGRIPDDKAAVPLMRLLKAKDPFVQMEAMRSLGAHKATAAVEALLAIANDGDIDPPLNRRALLSLGEVGDAKAVPTLLKMMFKQHKRGDTFYGESSFALYGIGAPAKDAVLTVLKGQDAALFSWAKANNVSEAALYAKCAQLAGDFQDHRAEPVLIQKLSFKTDDENVTTLVRVAIANALGRLRSKASLQPIAAMVKTDLYIPREAFSMALARIGGRDALPQLTAATRIGLWDAREGAINAVAMLGDEREIPLLDKLRQEELKRTADECEEEGGEGCEKPDQAAQKRVAKIAEKAKRLEAAKECSTDATCWAKKLEAKEGCVRERAALELGRTEDAKHAEALAGRISDTSLEARVAAIQALDWITTANPGACAPLVKLLPAIEKQLEDEKGRSEYTQVNEDLRRFAAKLRRAQKT
jgi:HEAT repeat protein